MVVENISKSEHARYWSVMCSTLVCIAWVFWKYFYQYRLSSSVWNTCISTFSATIVTVLFKNFKHSVMSISIDFTLLYSVSKVSNLSFPYYLNNIVKCSDLSFCFFFSHIFPLTCFLLWFEEALYVFSLL